MTDPDDIREGADDAVREVMEDHGDDGTTPRHTLFYFYGGDLDRLKSAAMAAGYSVSPTHAKPGLVLECVMAVDEAHFDPIVARMLEWADDFGSDFDGWECALLTN